MVKIDIDFNEITLDESEMKDLKAFLGLKDIKKKYKTKKLFGLDMVSR